MSILSLTAQHRYDSGFVLDVAFSSSAPVTALVGPSGGGKSTILAIIAGLVKPQSGRVALGEHVWLDTERGINLPPEERGVGVVFQDLLLFPHLSVRANLAYGMRRQPAPSLALEHVAHTLDITELLDRSPHTLSGGQQQRVALARALLRGPELLLLDEPLSALDPELRGRVIEYVQRIVAEYRVPTLLVSHHGEDVRRLAQHIITLAAGRVVAA